MLNWFSVEEINALAATDRWLTFAISTEGRCTVLTVVDALKQERTIFELESVEEAKARAEKFLEDK